MVKFQGLFILISSAVILYAFIECAMRDESAIQKLPKWGWLLTIFLFSLIGSIAYLAVGRIPKNRGGRGLGKKPKPRQLPPDDNPDFLRGL